MRLCLVPKVALIAALASAAGPACASAQATVSPDSLSRDVAALGVATRPWSTMVSITVLIPRGSAQDPMDLSGASRLLAEVVRARVAGSLPAGQATVTVEVARAHTVFQAVAVPEAWRGVYDQLLDAIFSAPLQSRDLEEERNSLLATARFESGAPVREFQDALYQEITGGDPIWSRDPLGSLESLQRIDESSLASLKERLYQKGESVVTLVGPFGREPGVRVYRGRSPEAGRTLAEGELWSQAERQRLGRPVTNSWIGAAFPVPADVSRTLLEFVRQRVSEELNPDPPDPGLFGADVHIEEILGGTVLVVEAAVLPEVESRWEDRVVRIVQELGERYRDPGFFRFQRRRFRTTALLGEGAPESQGRRMALDLLRRGDVRHLDQEIDGMDPEALQRVVTALGEPRLLVFGPDLGDGGS